jgi:hypothetical protein
LGTRFGFGTLPADADAELTPPAGVVPGGEPFAEPLGVFSVVEIGPATAPVVSDVTTFDDDACVVEPVVLLFAAEADFAPPPLHAQTAATRAIEKRAERYIFPRSGQE